MCRWPSVSIKKAKARPKPIPESEVAKFPIPKVIMEQLEKYQLIQKK